MKRDRKIRILYSGKALSLQKYGGVSRYFCEIIKRIDSNQNFNLRIASKFFDNVYFREYYSLNNIKHFRFCGKIGKLLDRLYFIIIVFVFRPDIIHSTYYDIYPDFLFKNVKHVTTIHDMAYERGLLPNYGNVIEKKKYHIYNSDIIIAVSEWTKEELLEIYPDINPSKVRVIYHGNSLTVGNSDFLPTILTKKYILFVGQRADYKNFSTLLNAFVDVRKEDDEIVLVCVGKKFNDEELLEIASLGLDEEVYQEELDDDGLRMAYKNAICFIYPSLYEGFGIPILEAWSCNCPIILSDIPVFREVAKDAAVFFQPQNVRGLYEKIIYLKDNKELRVHLIDEGIKQLRKYEWDKTAIETERLYNSLIYSEYDNEV